MRLTQIICIIQSVRILALPTNFTNSTSSYQDNHDDPNLSCVPTQWTDVATFFIGNYFAHAATVKSEPGEGFFSFVIAAVGALFVPASGLVRGINAIIRNAKFKRRSFWKALFRDPDYQTAAQAGALCMVVRRRSWKPHPEDKVVDVLLRSKCKAKTGGKAKTIIKNWAEKMGEDITRYSYNVEQMLVCVPSALVELTLLIKQNERRRPRYHKETESLQTTVGRGERFCLGVCRHGARIRP
jgi:hypothetical protein